MGEEGNKGKKRRNGTRINEGGEKAMQKRHFTIERMHSDCDANIVVRTCTWQLRGSRCNLSSWPRHCDNSQALWMLHGRSPHSPDQRGREGERDGEKERGREV